MPLIRHILYDQSSVVRPDASRGLRKVVRNFGRGSFPNQTFASEEDRITMEIKTRAAENGSVDREEGGWANENAGIKKLCLLTIRMVCRSNLPADFGRHLPRRQ